MITRDQWWQLSSIMLRYQQTMLAGWIDEVNIRRDLLIWLRDNDMPCEMIELADYSQQPTTGIGCRGVSLDNTVDFEFDAEDGEIVFAKIPYVYFGQGIDNIPGSSLFIVTIFAERTEKKNYQISFSVKGNSNENQWEWTGPHR